MRMVQYAMTWLEDEEIENKEKIKIDSTLISVTEGKIFVEVERARLTRKLAEIKEKDEKNIVLLVIFYRNYKLKHSVQCEKRKMRFLIRTI